MIEKNDSILVSENSSDKSDNLIKISEYLRKRILKMVLEAGSGHFGGNLSSVELLTCLYFGGILNIDINDPENPDRDRLLLRGHIGPLRYNIFNLLGWMNDEEMSGYRRLGSRLQGHEDMKITPGVDITPSGSLGMLLSYGVGAALEMKQQKRDSKIYVMLGDGEEEEGNVSEAARHAVKEKLDNLVCILDRNGKQLGSSTRNLDSADVIKVWEGYGFNVFNIKEGHNINIILKDLSIILDNVKNTKKPTLIVVDTIKGNGIKGALEHFNGYHSYSSCPKDVLSEIKQTLDISNTNEIKDMVENIKKELLLNIKIREGDEVLKSEKMNIKIEIPNDIKNIDDGMIYYLKELSEWYEKNETKGKLYVMTADLIKDTDLDELGFYGKSKTIFKNVGIREQHLLAMAHGLSISNPDNRIVIIENDAFLYRFSDQLNAIAQGGSKITLISTDAGICEARNGSTHQSTGQSGAVLTMPGIQTFEPGDVKDFNAILNYSLSNNIASYIRTHNYDIDNFVIDSEHRNLNSYIAYAPKNECNLQVVSSGFMLDTLLKIAQENDEKGIGIKIINAINQKDLGKEFNELIEDQKPMFAIYNGNPFTLQASVSKNILESEGKRPSVINGHGFDIGTSGTFNELSSYFGFDQDGITKTINEKFNLNLDRKG